jgi:hypothetical protein
MNVLPELSDPVTDYTQCGKWTKEIDLTHTTLVWANWKSLSAPQFFVNELAQLHGTERYFVPLRWITLSKKVYAEGYSVEYNDEVHSCYVQRSSLIINPSCRAMNFSPQQVLEPLFVCRSSSSNGTCKTLSACAAETILFASLVSLWPSVEQSLELTQS